MSLPINSFEVIHGTQNRNRDCDPTGQRDRVYPMPRREGLGLQTGPRPQPIAKAEVCQLPSAPSAKPDAWAGGGRSVDGSSLRITEAYPGGLTYEAYRDYLLAEIKKLGAPLHFPDPQPRENLYLKLRLWHSEAQGWLNYQVERLVCWHDSLHPHDQTTLKEALTALAFFAALLAIFFLPEFIGGAK